MSDWTPYLTGLPLVAINELDIQQSSRKLRVGTYGRGVWENDLVTVPVPVRWINFSGKRTAAGNQLSWKVEENSSTDKYELEYSANGVRFATIKTIDALARLQNSSSLTASYSQADAATGDAYYRLKQFDKNGRFYYSDIIFLKDARKEQLILYPNPVQDKLSISIPGNFRNTNAIVQVYNTGGILLLQQTESSNTCSINTARFSSGQYILRVTVDEKVYQQVFFKGK
jgi:Secretion system C-terminal sorting domain